MAACVDERAEMVMVVVGVVVMVVVAVAAWSGGVVWR